MLGEFGLDFSFKAEAGAGGVHIEGYASAWAEDRDRESIDRRAFEISAATYFRDNPIVLWDHGMDPLIGRTPLGTVKLHLFDDVGLLIRAWIPEPAPTASTRGVYDRIADGTLKTLSIGGRFERVGSVITKIDLGETSVVAVPANPQCLFAVVQKAFDQIEQGKSAGCGDCNGCNSCGKSDEPRTLTQVVMDRTVRESFWTLMDGMSTIMHDVIANTDMDITSKLDHVDTMVDEFRVHARNMVTTASAAGTLQLFAALESKWSEGETILSGATKAGTKAGAMFSAANMAEMQKIRDRIGDASKELTAAMREMMDSVTRLIDKAKPKEGE